MRLRNTADFRTLAFVLTYFGLLTASWIVAPTAWWAIALAVIATSIFGFFGAVITHNTIHTPMFKSKRMNKFWQVVLTQTYGHPVSTFVPGHNMSHHRHVQTKKDVMRTQKTARSWHLLNLFLFMPAVSGSIMKNDIAFAKAMQKQRKKWFNQLVIEGVVFVGISIALVVMDWQKWLLYWQIPHMFAGWGIITMNLLQHDGCDVEHKYNHSRTFTGKLINWWTFNNGYHGIHHDHPTMHWSKLPAAHAAEITPHIHPALEQKSMAGYMFRTFVYPGKRETYDGKPYTPEPAGIDENWIPRVRDTPDTISFGAEGF